MKFFIMECEGPYPVMPIRMDEATRRIPSPWNRGCALSERTRSVITGAIRYEFARPVDLEEPQCLKAMYKAEAIPLMHTDLVAVLQAAGVDNLELFPAVIENPETGEQHTDYKAYNIVGLIDCVDGHASTLMGTTELRSLDTDFGGLVIDEARVGEALLFRIGECISAIAVHESVKKKIEASGIPGIVFYGPDEWSG